MKAIMIMYDSLCRDLLPCYGGKIELPNFKRLAEKTAVFDNCYVCSPLYARPAGTSHRPP